MGGEALLVKKPWKWKLTITINIETVKYYGLIITHSGTPCMLHKLESVETPLSAVMESNGFRCTGDGFKYGNNHSRLCVYACEGRWCFKDLWQSCSTLSHSSLSDLWPRLVRAISNGATLRYRTHACTQIRWGKNTQAQTRSWSRSSHVSTTSSHHTSVHADVLSCAVYVLFRNARYTLVLLTDTQSLPLSVSSWRAEARGLHILFCSTRFMWLCIS